MSAIFGDQLFNDCRPGPALMVSPYENTNYMDLPSPKIDVFGTGANRDSDKDKLDYEGFLSPEVLERFAEYMHSYRHMPDGSFRDSDNWQKGIPLLRYMKSMWRHFHEVWKLYRKEKRDPDCGSLPGTFNEDLEIALCGLLFNAMGYLHEMLKRRNYCGW